MPKTKKKSQKTKSKITTTELRFNVDSGVINITDPCYTYGLTDYGMFDVLAKKGAWVAEIIASEAHEGRCIELRARHITHTPDWTSLNTSAHRVGVDSGQLGIFCDSIYPRGDSTGGYDEEGSFYNQACKLTCGLENGGVLSGAGVVVPSGYGDGLYPCALDYGARPRQKVTHAVRVIFVDPNED